MQKLKTKPYALFLRRDELRRILPKEISISASGDSTDLFGVVIDMKAMDKIDNPELFMEYAFGVPKKKPSAMQGSE